MNAHQPPNKYPRKMVPRKLKTRNLLPHYSNYLRYENRVYDIGKYKLDKQKNSDENRPFGDTVPNFKYNVSKEITPVYRRI